MAAGEPFDRHSREIQDRRGPLVLAGAMAVPPATLETTRDRHRTRAIDLPHIDAGGPKSLHLRSRRAVAERAVYRQPHASASARPHHRRRRQVSAPYIAIPSLTLSSSASGDQPTGLAY